MVYVAMYKIFIILDIFEKLAVGIATFALYVQGRAPLLVADAGTIDRLLATYFALAFRPTRSNSRVERRYGIVLNNRYILYCVYSPWQASPSSS
jgi:hypothetical protein